MPRKRAEKLTTPDLVLLSLLAEASMHGYQANAELERRQVRDWAAISRPQVYYSMDKLARLKLIRPVASSDPAEGPERRVFKTTKRGLAALAGALESAGWTNQRERPPFLTWMALSWQARPGTFLRQLNRREQFLKSELIRERKTFAAVLKEVGHAHHEAVWMISLVIAQFEAELQWLRNVQSEAVHRARAENPDLAPR
ncbi:MAG TPA: helix-turn-helix transcriptional regulator [Candidatus Acidoferrales bacterium]|nr:helix-turn-helix transcriptional regulator [Candidatus Acidoferrales bacterium]